MSRVTVLPKQDFGEYCLERNLNDMNVEKLTACAFISICCSPICKEYWCNKYNETDDHFFKQNHHNVINLDFDDVEENGIYENVECFTINSTQAYDLYNFIENNKDKNFIIHCRAGKSRSRAIGVYIIEHYGHEANLSYGNDLSDRGNCSVISALKRMFRLYNTSFSF